MSYTITIDLCKDYDEMIRVWMGNQGIRTESNGLDLWYEFFNLQKKTILPKKRKVFYSKEFVCPQGVEKGLRLLTQKFESGDDVSIHLSKDANTPSKFDELLYDWGIYHLHLGEVVDEKTGLIKRTGPLLFAKIDEKNVYYINIYSHGKQVQKPWFKQEMIKIIHNNWPEAIKEWRLPDGVNLYPESISPPTNEQYASLRKAGINTAIFVAEGIAYLSPGGGYTSTGHSAEIILYCQRIHNTLKRYELYIKENITSVIEQVEKDTGKLNSNKLIFKLIERDGSLYIAELQTKVIFFKVAF